jgi:SAM-dependent methyltransferase
MTPAASTWLERWDAQQETYLPDREEHFEVLIDLVETVAGPAPRVLDLACGPGSLGTRLLARLPEASVVGVDADPVLLALGRATAPAGLRLIEADLRRAERRAARGEDWLAWWDAVRAEPELKDAVAERDRRAFDHPATSETSLAVHEPALRAAGFTEVGVVWRKGTDAVLVAVR